MSGGRHDAAADVGGFGVGQGEYVWADGCVYTGEVRHNELSGLGRMDWPCGDWCVDRAPLTLWLVAFKLTIMIDVIMIMQKPFHGQNFSEVVRAASPPGSLSLRTANPRSEAEAEAGGLCSKSFSVALGCERVGFSEDKHECGKRDPRVRGHAGMWEASRQGCGMGAASL